MGFLDRLLGRTTRQAPPVTGPGSAPPSGDTAAIERYRYLLRTVPPGRIEQAHEEAFAQLSPEQRRQLLAELSRDLPPEERPAADDPRTLARAATRAELRSPGTLERSLGGRGVGVGGLVAGSLLASVAGAFVGTAIAQQMVDEPGRLDDAGYDGSEATGSDHAGDETRYGDFGGGDGGGDFGGGDFGGDVGGGDF